MAAHAGDWQYGGTPVAPNNVFGAWTSFTETVNLTNSTVALTAGAQPAANGSNLGTGSDPAPAGSINQAYGAEARWNISSLGLIPGHSYRFYVIMHDSDQNKAGGDAGQACVDVLNPGPATPPNTPVALGSGMNLVDSAKLASGSSPTGTITFMLYNPSHTVVYTDTVTVSGNGTYDTSSGTNPGGYLPTVAGTYQWVATYNGDANNNPISGNLGDEPAVVTGPPTISVTKTADSPTITGGGTAGYTVVITNNGTMTDNGVTLSDLLPAGAGSDINWQIDTTTGNPTDFQITGSVGSQSLGLSSAFISGMGDSLAPGQSITVHITGLTSVIDAGGSTNPALNVGGLAGYVVLYEGTDSKQQLSISNDIITGNIGVAGGQVQFTGPGTINGRVNFSAANSGQFHSTNGSNVGPTSVNYNVSAVTTAINAANSLSTALGGLPGANITFNNANQTVNESSGLLETTGGVTYRVFNVTSYSETNANTVTINGDGSGDPVVFNFAYNKNTNLGGQVVLAGGLTPDQIVWNFTSTNQQVNLNNNGGTFQGVLLLPNDQYQSDNSNLDGRVYGGAVGNMQIVSGANVYAPTTGSGTLSNTATVGATGAASQQSTATITLQPPVTVNVTGGPLVQGQTATIGFWHNNNGQALIDSFNGGPNAKNLGNWLATTFPDLYGGPAGPANNLTGQTNAQVAAYYLTLFSQNKTAAQVLASALAVYATNSALAGGTMAASYGFTVSTSGTAIATYDVGTTLSAYSGPTGPTTVYQLLLFVDSQTTGGNIAPGPKNQNLLTLVNTIFTNINQNGDIVGG